MHLRLGLDLTVFQLRSHTWFQHSVKLRFLMSHCRKNSVRDKVIGKKWIYLKRNTLHRQCGPSENVSCCSVTQLCLTLCYPMDCSTPVFPILHYLPKFPQTHIHQLSDAKVGFYPEDNRELLQVLNRDLIRSAWKRTLKPLTRTRKLLKICLGTKDSQGYWAYPGRVPRLRIIRHENK